ncbi:MAG: penicillin acylase family protein [bacterium]|nr:penicillin acylase family protein [bacterium]
MDFLRATFILSLFIGGFPAPTDAASPGDVTIYRDVWGVPHIYGDSPEAAVYGHGYAQAQDRLDDILTLYTFVQGKAAKFFGPRFVQQDYETQLARHPEVARSGYPSLAPDTRRLIEFYIRGIHDYIREHPDARPEWADMPRPYDVVSLYRFFIWDWPWGQALEDLKHAGSHVADGRGSNQWVVSASRSAEGGPIALIDPHLTWNPANRFYESHVHGGDLHFYGFSIVGTPFMALGHTDVFSLSATTGGPDCADVYEEKINPDNPLQYEYDGQWRDIQVEEIDIEVHTQEGVQIVTRKIERTHHGPIVKRKDNRAYAVKTAYDNEVGMIDQWLDMIKAQNLGEFLLAVSQNQSLPQNLMYADIHGNTYYVRAGRVPVRPKGTWDSPMPGWTSNSEWQGIHPLSDLVQVLNPGIGFMQNCNIAPGAMMPYSSLNAKPYLHYIYNDRPTRTNERGRRALQLLETHPKLTLQQATDIALDTFVLKSDMWQQALDAAFKAHPTPYSHLQTPVQILLEWDGRMDIDSKGASIFSFWIRACRKPEYRVSRQQIERGRDLGGGAQRALLKALDDAVQEMQRTIGKVVVPWGDIHRAQRGTRSWPVAGFSREGINTLRSVNSQLPDENGISYVHGGQFCTTVVLLKKDGIVSYSATPYGQSNHAESTHFTDQGELLFSKGRLKPTWYQKEDMLKRVKSKTSLKVPSTP